MIVAGVVCFVITRVIVSFIITSEQEDNMIRENQVSSSPYNPLKASITAPFKIIEAGKGLYKLAPSVEGQKMTSSILNKAKPLIERLYHGELTGFSSKVYPAVKDFVPNNVASTASSGSITSTIASVTENVADGIVIASKAISPASASQVLRQIVTKATPIGLAVGGAIAWGEVAKTVYDDFKNEGFIKQDLKSIGGSVTNGISGITKWLGNIFGSSKSSNSKEPNRLPFSGSSEDQQNNTEAQEMYGESKEFPYWGDSYQDVNQDINIGDISPEGPMSGSSEDFGISPEAISGDKSTFYPTSPEGSMLDPTPENLKNHWDNFPSGAPDPKKVQSQVEKYLKDLKEVDENVAPYITPKDFQSVWGECCKDGKINPKYKDHPDCMDVDCKEEKTWNIDSGSPTDPNKGDEGKEGKEWPEL